ncbi:MAG: T9SS type A sorting domain-containing protein [Sphingobacteriaceae bacterium]|nr:T9SS type A sorting domain-containing protein [Sphingobacteriaceae bacterium]
MKKLLLIALMGGFASASIAQNSKPLNVRDELKTNSPYDFGTTTPANNPENGATLWTQNFNAPVTGVSFVRGSGAGGGSTPWEIVSTQPANLSSQGFPAIASTSGAPFALINSDLFTNGTQDDYLVLKVGANLSTATGVVLSWQQYFRRFQETHKVQVSNDSLTWTDVYNSSVTVPVNTTIANPTTISVNISSVAAGQANVWVRFHYVGAWDWFWAVDNVALVEPPANDLVLENYSLEFKDLLGFYGQIPVAQAADSLRATGAIYNFGVNAQSTTRFNTKVNAGTNTIFNNSTANFTLLTNRRDTVNSTALFPVEGRTKGNYSIILTAEMDSVDANPLDNSITLPFAITDSIYSAMSTTVTRATTLGTASFTGNADGFIAASLIELTNVDTITAVRIHLGSTTVAGGIITAAVRDTNGLANSEYANAFSFTPLIESEAYTVTAADITRGFVDILIPRFLSGTPQNLILPAGAYYLSAELISNGGASHIRIIDDLTYERFAPFYQSIIYLPAPPNASARWYTNGVSMGISGVFGDARRLGLNVNDLQKNLSLKSVYPNPAKNEVNISYQLTKAAEVSITIRDIAGRTVMQSIEGLQFEGTQKATLTLNGLNAGMYFVELNAGGAVAQQKLIISK